MDSYQIVISRDFGRRWAGPLALLVTACSAPASPPAGTPTVAAPAGTPTTTVAAPAGTPTTTVAAPSGCRDLGATPQTPPTPLLVDGSTHAQGIDVSDAQGEVPWLTLKQGGVAFAFARASEGDDIHDRHFKDNWATMKACGLPRGAYHVFEPTQPAEPQVELFLAQLGGDFGELPPVLDIEITREAVAKRKNPGVFPSTADYKAALLQWLTAVEAKTGKAPMIYIQPWYWQDYLGSDPAFTRYALWAAGTTPPAADHWAWTFWQHGEPAQWDGREWDRDFYKDPTLAPK